LGALGTGTGTGGRGEKRKKEKVNKNRWVYANGSGARSGRQVSVLAGWSASRGGLFGMKAGWVGGFM
jgi:hypothetical protein